MKRSKVSLSHYRLLTCMPGKLVPVSCFEVLPGDSIQQTSSLLMRLMPQLAPVMHPVSVRLHHFYVPYRLVWEDWEDFITGGADGEDASVFPTITAGGGGFTAKTLPDYLGVKPGVASLEISALPVRAYNLIFNEWYRDEDLVTPLAVPVTAGADATSPLAIQSVAWEKDYFTSSRPWPQKGPGVSLPLGTTAPVLADTVSRTQWSAWRTAGGNTVTGDINLNATTPNGGIRDAGAAALALDPGDNLYADLSAASSASVDDLRLALALQRYQEVRARFGSRYTEYLAYLGVRSSDARLQRPEYLGGGKQTVAFTEVLQTGPDTSDEGVADLKGHGIAALRSRAYRRFFEEHGVVLSLLSVRPRTMYADGLPRMWSRRVKEDFWQRELELIGQQQVPRREVYAEAGAGGDTVFGYQDRYAEYRHEQSGISGEFRSTLNYWHLGRIFAAAPSLNAAFVSCDPANRIYAETSADTDKLWLMVSHKIAARRLVTNFPSPRIL